MDKILITGGTGLVGKHLTQKLIQKGYEVVFLSRREGIENGIRLYKWDISSGYIDINAFKGVSHIIHLAGAGIADKRWSDAYKNEIYASRIQSTKLLVNTINKHQLKVQTFVSTSAIGIYGNNTIGLADENYPFASNFLAKVCVDWEAEAQKIDTIRTVIVRVGVVLANEAGFIPEIAKPIKYFIGASLGNGKQFISWIHLADLCDIYIKAIEDKTMMGPYNAVANTPITNDEITSLLAQKLNRPILLPPIPKFMLTLIFGQVADTLVANQQISSQKLTNTGFKFQFPQIDNALSNLL